MRIRTAVAWMKTKCPRPDQTIGALNIAGEIRTPDLSDPNRTHYQAVLLLCKMGAETGIEPAQEAYETPLATQPLCYKIFKTIKDQYALLLREK